MRAVILISVVALSAGSQSNSRAQDAQVGVVGESLPFYPAQSTNPTPSLQTLPAEGLPSGVAVPLPGAAQQVDGQGTSNQAIPGIVAQSASEQTQQQQSGSVASPAPVQMPQTDNRSGRPNSDDLLTPDPRGEIARISSLWSRGEISFRALSPRQPLALSFPSDAQPSAVWLSNNRNRMTHSASWVAPAMTSQPTYFEDLDLEIYGYTRRLQPLRSGLRFYGNVLLMPWEMINRAPWQQMSLSGVERPGSCAASVKEHRR